MDSESQIVSHLESLHVRYDPSLERTFRGHQDTVMSVGFRPGMKQLASGSLDGSAMIWNFQPQLRAMRYSAHDGPVTEIAWAPNGETLASGGFDKTVKIWTPTVKGSHYSIKAHAGTIRSVSYSCDGSELLTASDDKSIKLFSVRGGTFKTSFTGHKNWVRSARLSSQGFVVSGGDDKSVKIWDKTTQRCITTHYDHSATVNSVKFHPDGSCIAAGSADMSIKLWDMRSKELVQHYSDHGDCVTSVEFHPSGNYLASTSKDGTVKLVDLREGRLLLTLRGHQGAVYGCHFSPDGKWLASGGADRLVLVWDTKLWRPESLKLDNIEMVSKSKCMPDKAEIVGHRSNLGKEKRALHVETSTRYTEYLAKPPANNVKKSFSHHLVPKSVGSSTASARSQTLSQQPATNIENRGQKAFMDEESGADLVPNEVQSTLQHIVGQLDVITRALTVLDERLTMTEDRVASLINAQDLESFRGTKFDEPRERSKTIGGR